MCFHIGIRISSAEFNLPIADLSGIIQSTQTFELVSISGFNPNDWSCRINAV